MESSGLNETTTNPIVTETFGTEESRYFGLLIGVVVLLFGTVGNGITVWAYVRNKNLQSSFNVLIANLCLIDLLFTVIVVPSILPGYVIGENIYSETLCSLIAYLYYVTLASSLYNLVAIAINRYIGIVLASSYQRLFSGRRLALCLASIWLVPALLYLPMLIGGAYSWSYSVMRCAIGSQMSASLRLYHVSLNIIFQAIPLLILIVAYTAIFRKVKQVKAKMKGHKKLRRSVKSTSSVSSNTRHKSSGNTSDDTGDEMRPSSLVEGIAFRPVKNDSEHKESVSNEVSQRGHEGTDDEIHSTEKHHSVSTSDELHEVNEIQRNSTKKRNSIWNILLQNKSKNLINSNGHALLQKTNSTPANEPVPNDDVMTNHDVIPDQHSEPPLPEMVELKQFHRKKSLSTPTLPTFDLSNFNLSRMENKGSYPTHFRQYQEGVRDSKISESSNDKQTRSRTMSETTQIITTNSVKIHKTRKEKLSTSGASDNESFYKNWQRKSTLRKSAKSKEEKQRRKSLKKKRERERQLAYSSFMICIAFAVCILPTSLLYLIRVLAGLTVSPSTILIVSCIAWLHAIVNPWIYGYLNTQYRKEYSRIFEVTKRKFRCSKKLSTTTAR